VDPDIKNEFDPLMVERIKNCLKHLINKNFLAQLHQEIYPGAKVEDRAEE
jgi:hypothetical protein